jgi:hypothetical protein
LQVRSGLLYELRENCYCKYGFILLLEQEEFVMVRADCFVVPPRNDGLRMLMWLSGEGEQLFFNVTGK